MRYTLNMDEHVKEEEKAKEGGADEETKEAEPHEKAKEAEPGEVLRNNVVRINMFSGPRCLSTALMYSFAARSDTTAFDEPLYGPWLLNHPDVSRPERGAMLETAETNVDAVVKNIILGEVSTPIAYYKHIAKQIDCLPDLNFMKECVNVLLVRDPVDSLASWCQVCPPTLGETGFLELVELYSLIRETTGKPPVIIEAGLLQDNPEGVLTQLCEAIGIPFDPAMLKWEPGPKAIDGCWAPWWYRSVHASTCFTPRAARPLVQFPPQYIPLLREVTPLYSFLRANALDGNIRAVQEGPEIPPVNRDILVWVGASLIPTEFAQVSVYDSSVQGGDAVWEGIRVYDGRIFLLHHHLERLEAGARAMAFKGIPTRDFIVRAIMQTLIANGMRDNVHIRLTLTRGVKVISSMNPVFNTRGCTLIVLAEHKPVGDATTYNNTQGIKLVTAAGRRNAAQCVDSKIHHCNMINNILAKIQANNSGAADAIMLDTAGFVSETNATNIFAVHKRTHIADLNAGTGPIPALVTPTADSCLPGVTRSIIIDLAHGLGMKVEERNCSLAEFWMAEEVFTTGTMGELTPVVEIDGRIIGTGQRGPVTIALQQAYRAETFKFSNSVLLPPSVPMFNGAEVPTVPPGHGE